MRTAYDVPLVLLSFMAGLTTFLVIGIHLVWLSLRRALRDRGCRLTYFHHDWTKVDETIAALDATKERRKYARWVFFLHFTYGVWILAMLLFILLGLFIHT